jgi:hypothetical protein
MFEHHCLVGTFEWLSRFCPHHRTYSPTLIFLGDEVGAVVVDEVRDITLVGLRLLKYWQVMAEIGCFSSETVSNRCIQVAGDSLTPVSPPKDGVKYWE